MRPSDLSAFIGADKLSKWVFCARRLYLLVVWAALLVGGRKEVTVMEAENIHFDSIIRWPRLCLMVGLLIVAFQSTVRSWQELYFRTGLG